MAHLRLRYEHFVQPMPQIRKKEAEVSIEEYTD
jgi:hypothetical protein